jgi:hypothetical protein
VKRCLIVLTVCVLALVTWVQAAPAQVPVTGVQTGDQSAPSDQAALAASGAAQTQPSNTNVSIRVLSPGDDGSVSQTNSVDSDATASNENSADQDASQEQSSGSSTGCCTSGTTGVQTSSQSAANEQAAAALSLASQTGAKNTNVPIRVGSEGDNGDVSQTNSVESEATASNENSAEQSADQDQSSGSGSESCCKSGSTGVQTADQKAENEQGAIAASKAEQSHPENTNVSIRVLSDGDNGDVKQTNSVDSEANASNSNSAEQSVDQEQSSGSGSGSCCKSGSTGVQTAGQKADNDQKAIAASAAKQDHPKNTNISIRVLSPGDDGSVEQTNSVKSEANASNENSAEQSVDQDQSSGSSGTGIQTADQKAENEQGALGLSLAKQEGASNKNIPIRVKSEGDNGDVEQTNSVDSEANASNENSTEQEIEQEQSSEGSGEGKCCKSGSTGIQVAGQKAENEQDAKAASLAFQEHAKNTNAPIRVHSDGDDGDVEQTNSVDSEANASNENSAEQSVDQEQSSEGGSEGKCCSSGTGIQTADQKAESDQDALGLSLAAQKGASNTNKPIRVKSDGDGGDVEQTNSVDSEANASNENSAEQEIEQEQSSEGGSDGKCCKSGSTGIQIGFQKAENEQDATAASLAKQEHAKNTNAPIRVLSEGDEGDVEQTNSVDSEANASNENSAEQSVDQDQSSEGGESCCSSGTGIQVAGQEAKNEQDALGLSLAAQKGASNSSTPIRVKSDGDGGDLEQSNSVDSEANASNENSSEQEIEQEQSGGGSSCKCHGDLGIQVAAQRSTNDQDAAALSVAFQEGASNKSKPIRVLSEGDDGDVEQSNSVDSEANAENSNDSDQSIDQDQSAGSGETRKCCASGLGIQVAGQESDSEQEALVASFAIQKGDHRSKCGCPSGASNVYDPIRVKSEGDGGDVEQSNSVDSDANGRNSNESEQSTEQEQSGAGSGLGIQVTGQSARNAQLGAALVAAIQGSPANASDPLRLLGGGWTGQSKGAGANGEGENGKGHRQSAHHAQ